MRWSSIWDDAMMLSCELNSTCECWNWWSQKLSETTVTELYRTRFTEFMRTEWSNHRKRGSKKSKRKSTADSYERNVVRDHDVSRPYAILSMSTCVHILTSADLPDTVACVVHSGTVPSVMCYVQFMFTELKVKVCIMSGRYSLGRLEGEHH